MVALNNINVTDLDDIQNTNINTLREWLISKSAVLNNIAVQPFGDGQRGIFASDRIEKDSLIIHIPVDLLMNPRTIGTNGVIMGDNTNRLTSHQEIALKLCQLDAQSDNNKWDPYMATLPDSKDFCGMPLTWSARETSLLPAHIQSMLTIGDMK